MAVLWAAALIVIKRRNGGRGESSAGPFSEAWWKKATQLDRRRPLQCSTDSVPFVCRRTGTRVPGVFPLMSGRRAIAGSLIGGLPETQEMLDTCAERGIVSDIGMIDGDGIEAACERMLRGDGKYRLVIDIASMGR